MITITYHIVLSNPRLTFVHRYSNKAYNIGNFCKVINLEDDGEDEGNIYKFMELSVHGKAIQLHSVTNPLTQYRRYGNRNREIPSYL